MSEMISRMDKNADGKQFVREQQRDRQARNSGGSASGNREFRLIDLFAGAGGMTLGFSKRFGHAFRSVWANDFNDFCVDAYNRNFGNHCIGGDLVSILNDPGITIPAAEVVIGGPPCQGFSLLNKNRKADPRKQLWRPYLDVVKRSGAKVFVMENVPQILGSSEYEEIADVAETMGFKLCGSVLCAADYGVPQTRRRAIIIGCNFSDPQMVFPPRKSHFNPSRDSRQISVMEGNGLAPDAARWRTVRDAIEDLPPPQGTEPRDEQPPLDLHFGRSPTPKSITRYRTIPEEGMNRFDLQKRAPELTPACWIRKKSGGTDLFGRLWWDRPAFTIRTEFFKPEKGRYLHPKQHRPITHREAARFQSFPDDFIFTGAKTEIAKQIGNAVPPVLGAQIADVVSRMLNDDANK